MRKTKTLAIAAIATGLLATPALAGEEPDNEYQGTAKGEISSYVGFDTRKGKVSNLTTYLLYSCQSGEGGPAVVRGKGKLEIKNGEFEGKLEGESAPVARGDIGPSRLEVDGKFQSKTKAKGTIKGVLKLKDGTRCTTGKLDWKAEKGGTTR